jgi:hypothetical protein
VNGRGLRGGERGPKARTDSGHQGDSKGPGFRPARHNNFATKPVGEEASPKCAAGDTASENDPARSADRRLQTLQLGAMSENDTLHHGAQQVGAIMLWAKAEEGTVTRRHAWHENEMIGCSPLGQRSSHRRSEARA